MQAQGALPNRIDGIPCERTALALLKIDVLNQDGSNDCCCRGPMG